MFGKALIITLTIVGTSSSVTEWLLFVEVSWVSDSGAVDGSSLHGLLRHFPSVPGFPMVVSVVPATR